MPEFIIQISKRKIVNTNRVKQVFADLKDGKYLIKITSIRKRSINQNSYYWACVVPLVKEGLVNAGYDEIKTDEEVHEIMKHLFLKRQVVSKKDGNVIEISSSTSDLTSLEFGNYLEEIYKWSSEYLNIYIPPPSQPIPLYNDVMIASHDENVNAIIVE